VADIVEALKILNDQAVEACVHRYLGYPINPQDPKSERHPRVECRRVNSRNAAMQHATVVIPS